MKLTEFSVNDHPDAQKPLMLTNSSEKNINVLLIDFHVYCVSSIHRIHLMKTRQ